MPYEVDEQVSRKKWFSNDLMFVYFWEADSGHFQRDFGGELVSIFAWNRDGKCCQDLDQAFGESRSINSKGN